MTDKTERGQLAVFVGTSAGTPAVLEAALRALRLTCLYVSSGSCALEAALRSRPVLIVIDGRGDAASREAALAACQLVKSDSFSAIVPVLALASPGDLRAFFEVGADEVVRDSTPDDELQVRLSTALLRNERDTDAHPSTRLPGARAIEAELRSRIALADGFAVCYVDLDHFKEFNDRYGWHNGDRIIRVLARILHDVVKGMCGTTGFVGHIGGDDFLCVVPLASMAQVCDEIIDVFDELIPLQYSEQDRRAGYFFGKDRRGQLHRVPLMTLSIGVATNQRRRFAHPAEVSELASEMKSFAKTLDGSVWAVDRRRQDEAPVSTAPVPPHPVSRPRIGQSR